MTERKAGVPPAHAFTPGQQAHPDVGGERRGAAQDARQHGPPRVAPIAAAADPNLEEADFVFVLDDVELVNADQPEVVVAEFRHATEIHLQNLRKSGLRGQHTARRLEAVLPWRASFHLVMPMIESWLFADPQGPQNAGATHLPALWNDQDDPERFKTFDAAYLADDGRSCAHYWALSDKQKKLKANKPLWLREGSNQQPLPRDAHPKHYLAWLCRDSNEHLCSSYREAGGGTKALAKLDWISVLSRLEHCTFLRAFVEDLADALGVPPIVDVAAGCSNALTSCHQPRNPRVLRNA